MPRRPPSHAACSITRYKKALVPPLLCFKEQKEMGLLLCRRRKGGSRDPRRAGHELFSVAVGAGAVRRPVPAVTPALVPGREPWVWMGAGAVLLGAEAGGCPGS